jgi:hypothetical protein
LASPARADEAHCGDFASLPPRIALVDQLRWDVAFDVVPHFSPNQVDGEISVGVTKIVDIAFQSLDIGLRANGGGSMTSPRSYVETVEGGVRFYPVKLRQAFGIDECGKGTKTRRWSEQTDGVGYLAFALGYGHSEGDARGHDAMLVVPGVGYEWNLGEGRVSSFFVQIDWRTDAVGNAAAVTLSGPRVTAGLRL